MRHETQRWDSVKVTAEVIVGGIGQTGKTPTVAVQKISNGQWLQNGGGSWGAGFATNNMVAVDATNMPGVYEYDVPSARISDVWPSSGHDGLLFKVIESDTSMLEHGKIDIEFAVGQEALVRGNTVTQILEALFRFTLASDDDQFPGGYYTGGAGTGTAAKFYHDAAGPPASASSRYVDRLAVLHDTGNGNGENTYVVRIGGIFNDGSDYFLLGNPDGTTFTPSFASGDRLYVGMSFATARVTAIEDDVITVASIDDPVIDQIVDEVWDEDIVAAHTTADTAGKILNDTSAIPTAADNADAVWDELIADHDTPASGTTGEALANAGDVSAIRTAVWDADNSLYLTAGTTGKKLDDAGSAGSPADIADAVWDEAVTGHTTADTFGRALIVTQGLVQANHRIRNPTYDPNGRMLTADLVIYASSALAIADSTPLATFNVTCTYDGDGNMTSLLSAE